MAATIASLLADFSPKASGDMPGLGVLRAARILPDPVPEPVQPPIDRQAELLKAIEAKARAEERESARLTLEEALAAERERFAQEMRTERETWIEQQAQQLSSQLLDSLGRIQALVSERVANILRPFVSDAFRQKALSELEGVLATVLSSGEAKLVRVAGPEDLLLSLQNHLASYSNAIEFCPGDHVEVSVVAGETTLLTQFETWSSRLTLALES